MNIGIWAQPHRRPSTSTATKPTTTAMSQFRAAKLDIGCFAKIRNIRDHTKRKVYSENEPERCACNALAAHIQRLTAVL
jgi:hypothetical protein